MADSEGTYDIGLLSDSQQLALQQFTSVTDQDLAAALPLLQRSQWNVQIAIAKFFDGEAPDPAATPQESVADTPVPRQDRQRETLLGHSSPSSRSSSTSARPLDPAPRIVPQPDSQISHRPPLVLTLLFAPFAFLYRFISSSLGLLSYAFPFLPRLFLRSRTASVDERQGPRRVTSGRRPLNPQDTAARFIREFEEEYGAQSLPFVETGYAQALDSAKRDLKFLLVILFSPEHDDTSTFARDTLLAPEAVHYITDPQNNILLWAGSVQDSEAYQVSSGLNCTKFPAAVVIAHTPQTSSTAMSVVARIVGPTPPLNFIAKLQSAISEHSPALDRVRASRASRQAERSIREEQNTAYERSLAQDRERARQRREADAARARAEQEAERKAASRDLRARNLQQWRRWRAQSLPPEPGPDVPDASRVSIRMPEGERVVRKFRSGADIEELYAFVECYDVLKSQGSPGNEEVDEPRDYAHTYGFRLASPMPRVVYELGSGGTVGSTVGKTGNLVVEAASEEDSEDDE
ncbi:MAG: hypothetical protein M1833_006981 [Piccolia ochrophora]|nr:MAG: hypothetical protein M1833_006981 [Piccolia ochrophora]